MHINRYLKALLLSVSLVSVTVPALAADTSEWKAQAQDTWISSKIEAKLLFDSNLSSLDIHSDVDNGVVTLTGQAPNRLDKRLAEEVVKRIDGVKSVNNQIEITNGEKTTQQKLTQSVLDAKIATVVKSTLLIDQDIDGTDIKVSVDDGVVTLSGEVSSASMSELAAIIAGDQSDVKKVINQITIKK